MLRGRPAPQNNLRKKKWFPQEGLETFPFSRIPPFVSFPAPHSPLLLPQNNLRKK